MISCSDRAEVLGAHEDAVLAIEKRALRLDDEHVAIVRPVIDA